MVAKPLCPLYKNIIKPLDRARYPELRYYDKYLLFQDYFFAVDDVNSLFWSRNALSLKIEDYFLGLDVTGNLANAVGYAWYSCS